MSTRRSLVIVWVSHALVVLGVVLVLGKMLGPHLRSADLRLLAVSPTVAREGWGASDQARRDQREDCYPNHFISSSCVTLSPGRTPVGVTSPDRLNRSQYAGQLLGCKLLRE